ncbi:MAG: cell division protein FtsQ/DivIB [Negativibacillus sp.]
MEQRRQAGRSRSSGSQQNQSRRPEQNRQAQKRAPQRRRKKKYTLHYLLLFLFCVGLGLMLCFTVLFKVNTIKVKNNTFYSAEELISRSGIQKGDSLFAFSAGDTEKMLEDRFPYLQDVKIQRRLPTTIIINVTEERPVGAAYTEDGYAVLSYSGKVLKTGVSAPPGDIPVLLGLEDETFTVGGYLYQLSEGQDGKKNRVLSEKVQELQNFLDTAEELGLDSLTYIDITDNGEIRVLYDGRILIDFGGEIDLDKKITFVLKVLEDGIANEHPLSGYTNENFEGTIDITNRKQLRTRAIAINTIRDERAFTVFEENDAFFADDTKQESLPEGLEGGENPDEDQPETAPDGSGSEGPEKAE